MRIKIFFYKYKKMYDQVSIGFELETQKLCLVQKKGSIYRLPTEYTKHAFFQKSVEVYNDLLTLSTAFVKDTLPPFLASGPPDSIGKVHGPWNFNNNEFVLTFSRKQSVPPDQLLLWIFQHFLLAIDRVESVLEQYEATPMPPGFPYPTLLVSKTRDPRYAGVGFLAQASPTAWNISQLTFYYQMTLGFLLDDAMGIVSDLAARYFTIKKVPNTVQPLVEQARTIPGKALQNYLFLYLYSATTRHQRKESLFVLRQAFQDIRSVLSTAELDTLEAWMKHHVSVEEYMYFQSLHRDKVSTKEQQKFKKQALWDVGRIPFKKSERRVFVEFRGFQMLLNDAVGTGPKSIARIRAAALIR